MSDELVELRVHISERLRAELAAWRATHPNAVKCGSRSIPITRFGPIRSVVSEVSDHPPTEAVTALM
jgi:hypothetical protein